MRLSIVCGFLLLTTAAAAEAPPAFRPISDFYHTAFGSEQGAPSDPYMLAQTPDGWLWLGGPNGLFRFDGVQFESVALEGRDPNLSSAIISLFAEESGDLWVGYIYGGVSRIGHGTMSHYGMAQGLPESSVNALERDAQGALLAATVRGLFRFDGTRWHS